MTNERDRAEQQLQAEVAKLRDLFAQAAARPEGELGSAGHGTGLGRYFEPDAV